jgi:hypothetical protein
MRPNKYKDKYITAKNKLQYLIGLPYYRKSGNSKTKSIDQTV